ncbi:MAG TPA: cobalamin-binding protein [Candidatus Angelobacter sp.]|nr:cobalamin-binding protein [Candidatus Angelobacter sp.]
MNGTLHARFHSATVPILAAFLCAAAPLRAQSAPSSSGTPATPEFREVVDEVGRTVRIPQPVRRIVSLAPSMTETIYALGLQDRLVGDTDFCDYPPDAQSKPKVGGAINPSLEKIASLHPDLVLVTKALNLRETTNALDELGISSYATDPHTVDDIKTSTKKLAALLGVPDAGAAVADEMQQRLASLHRRLDTLTPKSVLFVVWTQPLISVGRSTFIADALLRAGAVSIVDSSHDWPQVSLEEIARLQPDYLVFADSHSETVPREIDTLATLPGWKILNAIANRRYAVISDAVNRPAPRIVSAIEDLARQLHPEAFPEKPSDAKEKLEKQNPPERPRTSSHWSLPLKNPLRDGHAAGGCPCAL